MSEERYVTVIDRVLVSGHISVSQLESYLRRCCWTPRSAIGHTGQPATYWSRTGDRHETLICTWPEMTAGCMAVVVESVARQLHRQPSEVLAEIAKEQS